MKIFKENMGALDAIQRNYQRGYTFWISFKIEIEKLAELDRKWELDYGTHLAPYQRQDRKQKGLPTAVAVASQAHQEPGKAEVILMATEHARTIKLGPFSREKWSDRYPTHSVFVLVREAREEGESSVFTWRIQDNVFGKLQRWFDVKSKAGDAAEIIASWEKNFQHWPMYGGVRRQFRRALRGARKLWVASHPTRPWPGPDPEKLPMMVGFKRRVGLSPLEFVERKQADLPRDENHRNL